MTISESERWVNFEITLELKACCFQKVGKSFWQQLGFRDYLSPRNQMEDYSDTKRPLIWVLQSSSSGVTITDMVLVKSCLVGRQEARNTLFRLFLLNLVPHRNSVLLWVQWHNPFYKNRHSPTSLSQSNLLKGTSSLAKHLTWTPYMVKTFS